MGDISDNFSRSEFACKCGCGLDTVDADLVMLSELVRKLNDDKSLTPNCGCRCEAHNKKVGGSKHSQHLLGRAADLPVINPAKIYMKLCEIFPDKFGFGLYKWGVHVDSRSNKARWGHG